jgi:hypothetical protein
MPAAVVSWLTAHPAWTVITVYAAFLAIKAGRRTDGRLGDLLDTIDTTMVLWYSPAELMVVLVSLWFPYVVISPSTGLQNLIDSLAFWVAGAVFLKPVILDRMTENFR